MGEYAADPRHGKIDLGVGVYKDEQGITPIMTSVKKAEQRILDSAKTKTYHGVVGNKGSRPPSSTWRSAASSTSRASACVKAPAAPARCGPDARAQPRPARGRIFVSDPTWPNHKPIAENAGLEAKTYPYFDPETRGVEFRRA